ncbi:Type 1 glutamine amidotransferase-like domain-containing protein [Solitalea lacus]|uniref:Type 1 glutamine amidotransferase-like domain-containing protein n=1 Tax=Solitalea lacus TaxID=2911172 RepID=UPI001EDAF54F|nr:Type 1 glutamine amidotransferase-like domain-containing protein [Solitalea lacus]UKJ08977.1 Type 1 glutamine amidotransferase-like domain-containing protein [Solitalea lacus]
MNLLLLSNSTNAGEKYLEYPKQYISSFLQKHNVSEVLFIPFAAVTLGLLGNSEESGNPNKIWVAAFFLCGSLSRPARPTCG